MRRGNIRDNAPSALPAEVVEEFLAASAGSVRFERIFSEGQASPEGYWYDQAGDEWVMLLSGGATVEFADPAGAEDLAPGDWLFIPAHRRHRVKRTGRGTLWLAIHMERD